MLSNILSKKLSNTLYDCKVIQKEEIEAYDFCFAYLIDMSFYITFTLICGFLLNQFILSILMLIVLISLRTFTGGVHAPSASLCAVLSYSITLLGIIMIPYFTPHVSSIAFPLLLLEYSIIFLLAPVDTPNKRLDAIEKKLLRKKCRISCFILFLIFLFFVYCNMTQYYCSIHICAIIPTTSLILGTYMNKKEK